MTKGRVRPDERAGRHRIAVYPGTRTERSRLPGSIRPAATEASRCLATSPTGSPRRARSSATPASDQRLGTVARTGQLRPAELPDVTGQVEFTPGGRKLIVTTKASGSKIVVFRVQRDGRLPTTPAASTSATPVPFAFTFSPNGRLASCEAGTSNLTTYVINRDGTLADPKTLSDGQMALCWIVRVGGYYDVTNTMSNTVSAFTVGPDGQPAFVGANGVVAKTGMGPIDNDGLGPVPLRADGLSGTVEAYRVNANGTLTSIGAVPTVVGQEGIASN